MRYLLAFLLASLLLVSAAQAQPVIDSGANHTNQTSGTLTTTVSASTSAANELVIVSATLGTNTTGGTQTATIAGCGLTWSLLIGNSYSSTPTFGIWTFTAFSAAILSTCTVTITTNLTIDDASVASYALSNVNQVHPTDPSASFPAVPTTIGTIVGTCAATNDYGAQFNTKNAHSIVFILGGSNSVFVQNVTPCNGETKFISLLNNGGTKQSMLYGQWISYTSKQTNALSGMGSTYNSGAPLQLIAFTADASGSAGGLGTLGVGQ
jgi:hypothetical protein